MSPDPFESPRLLIDGARRDVENLDLGFKTFVSECKAISIQERDPETGEHVAKWRFPTMPGDLRVYASNALNNLRHALDQAVNCAALQLGGGDGNYFPFAKDATDIDRVLRVNCKTVPSTLHPLLKGFQPYPGGDNLLCVLRISGKNKHRRILELKADLIGATYVFRNVMGNGSFQLGNRVWDSEKQELEYARVGPAGHLESKKMEAKVALRVLLSDTPTPCNEPAATVLNALAGKVECILSGIEAETARRLAVRKV